MANLINSGILPLVFADEADYDKIDQGDELVISGAAEKVIGSDTFTIENKTKGFEFKVRLEVSERLRGILTDGGLLNHTKKAAQK
jgi:aconitate hydratase